MHQQAQLRLKSAEIEKLGAAAFVLQSVDLYRTKIFKEENLLLSTFKGPFQLFDDLVFATALSDPSGRAAATYGVARKRLRWGGWAENQPCWFVIDRNATFEALVTIDLEHGKVILKIDDTRIEHQLPGNLESVAYVGIYAKGTKSEFSKIERVAD